MGSLFEVLASPLLYESPERRVASELSIAASDSGSSSGLHLFEDTVQDIEARATDRERHADVMVRRSAATRRERQGDDIRTSFSRHRSSWKEVLLLVRESSRARWDPRRRRPGFTPRPFFLSCKAGRSGDLRFVHAAASSVGISTLRTGCWRWRRADAGGIVSVRRRPHGPRRRNHPSPRPGGNAARQRLPGGLEPGEEGDGGRIERRSAAERGRRTSFGGGSRRPIEMSLRSKGLGWIEPRRAPGRNPAGDHGRDQQRRW